MLGIYCITSDSRTSSMRLKRWGTRGRWGHFLRSLYTGVAWEPTLHTILTVPWQRAGWWGGGGPVVSPPERGHSHRRSVLDVIFLCQLFTGEAIVLLPESLTLPTGFLGIKERHKDSSWWGHTTHKFLFYNRKCETSFTWLEFFLRMISKDISQRKR